MDLHSFDKARDIRRMVKLNQDRLAKLEKVKEIQIVQESRHTFCVHDMKREITEHECCEDIDAIQNRFIMELRTAIEKYNIRLEMQFENI